MSTPCSLFEQLLHRGGFRAGELAVVYARPGMGKTGFMTQAMHQQCMERMEKEKAIQQAEEDAKALRRRTKKVRKTRTRRL